VGKRRAMRRETSGDRERDLRRTYPCAQRYAHRRDGASESAQGCRQRRATRTENKQNNEIAAKWIWGEEGCSSPFPVFGRLSELGTDQY